MDWSREHLQETMFWPPNNPNHRWIIDVSCGISLRPIQKNFDDKRIHSRNQICRLFLWLQHIATHATYCHSTPLWCRPVRSATAAWWQRRLPVRISGIHAVQPGQQWHTFVVRKIIHTHVHWSGFLCFSTAIRLMQVILCTYVVLLYLVRVCMSIWLDYIYICVCAYLFIYLFIYWYLSQCSVHAYAQYASRCFVHTSTGGGNGMITEDRRITLITMMEEFCKSIFSYVTLL